MKKAATTSPRARLRAALRGERWGSRVPWSPLIDGYYLSGHPEAADALDANTRIGSDALVRHVFTWSSEIFHRRDPDQGRALLRAGSYSYEARGVTVTMSSHKEADATILARSCALGGCALTDRFAYTPTSPFIPFPLEYPIKTVDDLHVYRDMVRRDVFHTHFEEFSREDARIGDKGLATDTGRTSPIQELIQHLVGIEAFYSEFLPDHPDDVHALIRTMHEKNLEAYEAASASPAEVVIDYENTSTTLISPHLYERYGQCYIDEYADIVHKAGKIFLTHRCGKLKALLPLIAKGRDDGIADISPEPTGDVSLWEARVALPGKILLGGLDATVLAAPSPEPARNAAREIIARTRDTAGVIVGSGDAVPQNARLENLAAVTGVVGGKEGGA